MGKSILQVHPFEAQALRPLLARVPSPSLEYLLAYLGELDASAVVRETPYVDRHYLDDFTSYYARSFAPPPTVCSRFHFFARLSADAVTALLDEYYVCPSERRSSIEAELQEAYLGFVVSRPLPGATFGRTVLRTYPADGRRHYEVVRPYVVNISGIKLTVQGLAYQQQDRGAAVCASTALWSSLQRVAYIAGFRTPTPSMITSAAQSPFAASHGLNELQMAQALANLGYLAELFAPEENRALFLAQVVSCLQSQLPVILLVTRRIKTGVGEREAGHAVAVTGFSEPSTEADVHLGVEGIPSIRMRGAAVDILYVHDDNLGSHAHYELRLSDQKDEKGNPQLVLFRGRSNKPSVTWWIPDEWIVRMALVPKPPKLRLSVDSLLQSLVQLRPPLEKVFPGVELHFGARFMSGVEYKRGLLSSPVDRTGLKEFMTRLALPRHIGVLSVYDGPTHRLDLLVDVSQVEPVHQVPALQALVAPGVPARSPAAVNLTVLAGIGGVPLLLAPPTAP